MWRDALKNAIENPPAEVWKNIDYQLDSSQSFEGLIATKLSNAEAQVPAEIWNGLNLVLDAIDNTTFEEDIASNANQLEITPPAFIWENIEVELDKGEERKPIIFFWGSRWIATGIAAMLLLIFSIPLLTNLFDKKPVSERNESLSSNSTKEEQDAIHPELIKDFEAGSINNNQNEATVAFASFEKAELTIANVKISVDEPVLAQTSKESSFEQLVEKAKVNLARLQGKAFSPYGNRFTLERKRLPMPLPNEENEQENNKNKSWLGFISGLAPFDPNISITNFESQALASAGNVPTNFFEYKSVVESNVINGNQDFEIPLSQPFNNIRQGSAINLGLDYGFKMAKNFSFQTGARYTRSSSFIQSNVYSYNPNTNSVSTFLESYYLTNEKNSRNNTLISSSEDIRNAYQFLMIPVQLGYHVPLFSKMDLSVSGGVSGDFLINNILDETPQGGSKLTPANSAYKAVNISGLGGMKINYAVNSNWDASIGANYQQALRSGVQETQTFSFRPKFFGISYGINYKLK